MAPKDALRIARERELDLVEIAPQAKPPVCKIVDYGKHRYEKQKREKQQRKSQHKQQLKEVRLHPRTDTHDLDFKKRHAREWLESGHKVKFSVFFKGREMAHKDIGRELLELIIEDLADCSKVDQATRMDGRNMHMTLAPDGKIRPKKKVHDDDSGSDDDYVESEDMDLSEDMDDEEDMDLSEDQDDREDAELSEDEDDTES